jgi:predicted metal-dependent phosphoesterase TrpH
MKLRALCTDFAEAGGSAIEIASGRQTQDEIAKLTRLAQDFGLHASVGSDFHRPWQHGPDLGVSTTLARGVPGVWEIVL